MLLSRKRWLVESGIGILKNTLETSQAKLQAQVLEENCSTSLNA